MSKANATPSIQRSVFYNVAGYLVPLTAALVVTPVLIRGYGVTRFGVLALAWALVSYAGILDLGTGRAIIKLTADYRATGRSAGIVVLVSTASWILLGFGLLSGFILFLAAEPLVNALAISPDLVPETVRGLRVLAASVPIVMLGVGFRGVLAGFERFDLINIVRVPAALAMFVGPLLALIWSDSIVWALASLVAARALALWAYYAMVAMREPFAGHLTFRFDRLQAHQLIALGGWMTVSAMAAPILLYIDRFVIGGVLSVDDVTFYVTPFEALARMGIVSIAVMGVMFPVFSSRFVSGDPALLQLYRRSTTWLLVVLGTIATVVALLAEPLLTLWLGADLAARSVTVARILAVGFALHGASQPPFNLLQASGRPDVTAKVHLVQAPFYIGYLLILTSAFGIVGTAIAWTTRVALNAVVLTILARRFVLKDYRSLDVNP